MSEFYLAEENPLKTLGKALTICFFEKICVFIKLGIFRIHIMHKWDESLLRNNVHLMKDSKNTVFVIKKENEK